MDRRLKLLSLLKDCAITNSLNNARVLHQKAINLGHATDPCIRKALVNLYLSLHLPDTALLVLQSARDALDISLWNGLIAFCAKKRLYQESLRVFRSLRGSSLRPDSYTFPSVLKALGALRRRKEGEGVHSHLVKCGMVLDVVVGSSMVGMYAKCVAFNAATRLFDEMPDRDVACWNTVLSCYYQDGQAAKVLEVFDRMRSCGFEPNSVTYTVVLSACGRLLNLDVGRKTHHDLVRRGYQMDEFISSAAVDMYARCGCLLDAREVFEQAPNKSIVLWNTVIGGYASDGDYVSCLELFSRMLHGGFMPSSTTVSHLLTALSKSSRTEHGKSIHGYMLRTNIMEDIYIYCALVGFYFKCDRTPCAEIVFREMPKGNPVSWNVMISGCVTMGCHSKALDYFQKMSDAGVTPNAITFTSALSACSQLAALEQGRDIHSCIIDCEFDSDEIVMAALLDMYAKCGAVEEARRIFDTLQDRDIVSWTSMITAYGSHGKATEALDLFRRLQVTNKKLDSVAFLAVITACVHGGLVDEGCCLFNQMVRDYGIKPRLEHYSCLVDLLGRTGRLQEAYTVIQRSEIARSDVGLLGSLLSACGKHKNLELGKQVASLIIDLDPHDHSAYVALANMYASCGQWADATRVRVEMAGRRLKKNPGCSWIEVGNKAHQFYVRVDSCPSSGLIYECLGSLLRHMEKQKDVMS